MRLGQVFFFSLMVMIGIHMPLFGGYKKVRNTHSKAPIPRYTKGLGHFLMESTANIIKDAVYFHRYLISYDTIKVILLFTPPYIVSRMEDQNVHSCFYDPKYHKNKNQMDGTVQRVILNSGDAGILLLSMFGILAWDKKLQTTGRIFAIGIASALVAKDLIKQARMQANLRPLNEHFNKKETFGGFPSGHMIEASYMLTLWGLQYGAKAIIPLGLLSVAMFGVLISSNRHFASQVVAGTGFGVAYGIAAYRLINKKLNTTTNFSVSCNEYGMPAAQFSYRF